jgi:cyanophycin synthetase
MPSHKQATSSAEHCLPASFAAWRSRLDREHIPPVITVTGTRGKTSVIRALESIFQTADLRYAVWTDGGVEIQGERQHGELSAWTRVLTRTAVGGLDLAVREIDWALAHTISLPTTNYPVVAVTNLCANSEACLLTPESVQARKALSRLRSTLPSGSKLIINADDYALSRDEPEETSARFLVGMNPDNPILRHHLERGGDAVWVEDGKIEANVGDRPARIVHVSSLPWTFGGRVPFAVQNAIIAVAIARSCGVPLRQISAGLTSHQTDPARMPGSFNVFRSGGATIVVERPMPSWFLRGTLRGTANLANGRQVRVIGSMPHVDERDLSDVGRLLGRRGGVLITHGNPKDERLQRLRHGAANNDVPPIFFHDDDERTAVRHGMALSKSGDALLLLAESPKAVLRLVSRELPDLSTPSGDNVGAA